MKFKNIKVYNFENALRGMRNPKNSWAKSDSEFGLGYFDALTVDYDVAKKWCESTNSEDYEKYHNWLLDNGILQNQDGIVEYAFIGPKDMQLAQTLINAGPEHRKFLRQIFVTVDITAPLYWWKEFDTYKVGTTANSTSTMHTLTNSPITLDCFETDDFINIPYPIEEQREELKWNIDQDFIQMALIPYLEYLRKTYVSLMKDGFEKHAKRVWKELIRWLPEGWLQTRTVTMTYENLLSMCSKGQRRFHKLTEWSGKNITTPSFIEMARSLPYAQEFLFIDEN